MKIKLHDSLVLFLKRENRQKDFLRFNDLIVSISPPPCDLIQFSHVNKLFYFKRESYSKYHEVAILQHSFRDENLKFIDFKNQPVQIRDRWGNEA